MSEPIKVGDVVALVRGHSCLLEFRGGAIFTVTGLTTSSMGGWTCPKCGERDIAAQDTHGAEGIGPAPMKIDKPFQHLTNGHGSIPLSFLKRIPPIEELDDVPNQEDMREPA